MKINSKPALLCFTLLLFLITNFAQAAIELAIETDPDPVQPGEPLNIKIVIANSGNSVSGNLVLQMVYPEHLSSVPVGAGIDGGDCIGTSCDTNELVSWLLGAMPAGSHQMVTLPPVVTGGTAPGASIPISVQLFENNAKVAETVRNVVVQNSPAFDIAVDEDVNPVAPGDPLVYTLTYSNRSAASATNSTLKFPLPNGVSFVSATGGGVLNGNFVEWNLNTLPARTGGEQKVTVNVGNSVVPGTILEVDKAEIAGTVNFLGQSSNALAATTVSNNATLALAIELNPDPVQAGETLNTALTVTNTTNGTLFGVTLELRYPEHLSSVSVGAGIDGGDCIGTSCDINELVSWQLGAMPPGSQQTVTLPPVVNGGTIEGTLITFNATANEDNNAQITTSNTVYVGANFTSASGIDSDGDGVVDSNDNCLNVKNANQRDTDNDKFGNLCDGDLDNSGFVNSIDLRAFKILCQ